MNFHLTNQALARQIIELASETGRTPEQFITQTLERYVSQLSPSEPVPSKAEGTAVCDENAEQISLEAIMDKTKSVLRYFTDNADTIMGRLEPGWDSGLLEVMNRLAKRINVSENETDLTEIANIVHDLTIKIPHFPPDDSPPQYFQLKDMKSADEGTDFHRHIENHKAALEEVFDPCFKRIEKAWRNLPSVIPPELSTRKEDTPWELMGMFRDDPTWLEIEQERDRDWMGGTE